MGNEALFPGPNIPAFVARKKSARTFATCNIERSGGEPGDEAKHVHQWRQASAAPVRSSPDPIL